MAEIPKIKLTNRVAVPGPGVLDNIFVKAGEYNDVVDRLNSITTANGTLVTGITLAGTIDVNGTADGLILDADGDTTISAPTDDQIDIEVGGSDVVTIDANRVTIAGGLTVAADTGITTSTANTLVPVYFTAAQETIAAGNPGAISVATYYTDVAVDAGGDAFTIASGTVIGQMKEIVLTATAGGTAVVTGAFRGADNTLTFTNAGERATLIWNGTDWLDIKLDSVTTLTEKPVLSTV